MKKGPGQEALERAQRAVPACSPVEGTANSLVINSSTAGDRGGRKRERERQSDTETNSDIETETETVTETETERQTGRETDRQSRYRVIGHHDRATRARTGRCRCTSTTALLGPPACLFVSGGWDESGWWHGGRLVDGGLPRRCTVNSNLWWLFTERTKMENGDVTFFAQLHWEGNPLFARKSSKEVNNAVKLDLNAANFQTQKEPKRCPR